MKKLLSLPNEALMMTRIVDHTPLAIIITTTTGIIAYVNHHTQLALNYQRDSLAGETIERLMIDKEGDLSFVDIERCVAGNQLSEGRVTLLCREGSELSCAVNAFGIDADNQSKGAIVFIFRDISNELTITKQLEKKNLELARLNTELIRSNAELKRVSELKSNFLSIASHELKTPLTSIKGYSDIIIENLRENLDPRIYQMIENINRSANRLHKIVNNILDVTRIDQKRLRLNPEDFEIDVVAQQCIEELEHFTEERKIKFKLATDKNLPIFYGDKLRIQQVFTNLFSNALKYSHDGSVVDVRILLEKDKRQFHLIVRDHGIGIDKEEQVRIFDPFYEVGSAIHHSTSPTKFMGGGTGLGLSIVKGIIERHGGRIWVESAGVNLKDRLGSEFHFLLPTVARINWNDDETKIIKLSLHKSVELDESIESVDRKPVLLFICENHETNEIARMILDKAFEIVFKSTAQEGILSAIEDAPSIIITDSQLSHLDGYRICRILRSMEETRDIPFALLSVSTDDDDIKRCFSCGADDYIVMPFDGRELLDKLWRLLMKKKEEMALLHG